jgi:predicted urease superfamily metal-dependent hydrolase
MGDEVFVLDHPAVRRGALHQDADPGEELLEVRVTALTAWRGEQPFERVLVVGEEPVECRCGVEDHARHDRTVAGGADIAHKYAVRGGCQPLARLYRGTGW